MITEQHLNQLPQIFTDVYHSNLDALERYIQQGGDVHIDTGHILRDLGEGKSNLFQFACLVGQDNIVERLLADGRIHPQANNNRAIRQAARNGHLDVVNRLLEVGCDPQAKDNDAICWAAGNGHLNVVNRLLEVGCDPQANNHVAICWAAESGHIHVVNRLLEAGCDPQAWWDNHAIRWAAYHDHKKVVCALYDASYRQGNPIPRNITPEVEAILDERIEYVSVMPLVFSKLTKQYQNSVWSDISNEILRVDDRLHDDDIAKVKKKIMAILQSN